jgi:hypothetical protein
VNHDILAPDDIRLLTELGMLGAGAGQSLAGTTQTLFGALTRLRPARDFGFIGLASMHLNAHRPDDAVRVLEQAQGIMLSAGADPHGSDVSMVKAFLGMALLMSRRTAEALALLESLRSTSQHPPALRMAHGLLGLPITDTTKESA